MCNICRDKLDPVKKKKWYIIKINSAASATWRHAPHIYAKDGA